MAYYENSAQDLIGFDPTPLIAGGIDGISAFALDSQGHSPELDRLAVRSALLGEETARPFHGIDETDMWLERVKALESSATSEAVARQTRELLKPWDKAVERAVVLGTAALAEAVAFDVLEGWPKSREIGQFPAQSAVGRNFGSSNTEKRFMIGRRDLGSSTLVDGSGETAESLSVEALFLEADNAELTASEHNPLETYYNRMRMSNRWRLGAIAITHEKAVRRLGLSDVNGVISSRTVILQSGYMQPDIYRKQKLLGVSLSKQGEGEYDSPNSRGRSSADVYEYGPVHDASHDARVSSVPRLRVVRNTLNEIRKLVPAGGATWQMMLDVDPAEAGRLASLDLRDHRESNADAGLSEQEGYWAKLLRNIRSIGRI